jgi:hypothetical protein
MEIYKCGLNVPKSRRHNKTPQIPPIKQIINWRNAPTYEQAKYLTKILHSCLQHPKLHTYDHRLTIHRNQ